MSQNELLERFGRLLMERVRDEAIYKFDATVRGDLRSARAKDMTKKLERFDEDDLRLVREIVLRTVDEVLHNVLFFFEESYELDVTCSSEGGSPVSLVECSDGLAGELYTEDGWIARFSSERSSLE